MCGFFEQISKSRRQRNAACDFPFERLLHWFRKWTILQ